VTALAATVFVGSLLGSLHCAGMCGGFVSFYAGADAGRGGPGRLRAHLSYHGGRLATYVALGALAGAVGSAVDRAGTLAGIGRLAAVAAGAIMAAWGIVLLLQALDVRLPWARVPARISRWLAPAYRRVAGQPPVVRALLLGLLSTLLPCGWLYAYAVVAAGTGRAGEGALVMAAFWLGTVPVLAALGGGIQLAVGPLRRRLPVVTSAALIAVGLLTLWTRASVPVVAGPGAADGHPPDCPMHRTAPAASDG